MKPLELAVNVQDGMGVIFADMASAFGVTAMWLASESCWRESSGYMSGCIGGTSDKQTREVTRLALQGA